MELVSIELSQIDQYDLLYTTLSLLGFNTTQVLKEYKIIFDKATFKKDNFKALSIIIHFLLNKLTNNTAQELYFDICYPCRTYCLEIFEQLENEDKIPYNFGKAQSIFEQASGQSVILFLSFLAEFTLRYQMKLEFPTKIQDQFEYYEDFKLQTFKSEFSKSKKQYDVNQIYKILSWQADNNLLTKKLKIGLLQKSITECQKQISQSYEKYLEKISKQGTHEAKIQSFAQQLTNQYQELRKENLKLQQQIKENKIQMPKGMLGQAAALDRIPKIDLINQGFSELNEQYNEVVLNDLIGKVNSWQIDSSNPENWNYLRQQDLVQNNQEKVEIDLNESYKIFNNKLEKELNQTFQVDEVEFLKKKFSDFTANCQTNIKTIQTLKQQLS